METIIDIIKPGLLRDLHIAERSFTLNKQINLSQKDIPAGNKTQIAKMLFDLTYTEMVLALCRLYDNPSKKYPTRCIKQLYQLFKASDYQIEMKRSSVTALRELKHLLDFPEMFALLKSKIDADFNRTVVEYLETIEVNDPTFLSINNIKQIRDKVLEHSEAIQLDTSIPYENIEVLINHAKEVLSFFALCYSEVHLTKNGDFYLSHESLDWASDFKSFIEEKGA